MAELGNTVLSSGDLLPLILTIVGSILIPLVGFMFLMRGFIRDTAIAAIGNVSVDIASLKAELVAYRDSQKELISLYLKVSIPGNPHPNKEVLLEKLRNDTITRSEAIILQEIMTAERDAAEDDNNILKAIIIIGILALVSVALNKRQEGQTQNVPS